jgi:hypothetical protein
LGRNLEKSIMPLKQVFACCLSFSEKYKQHFGHEPFVFSTLSLNLENASVFALSGLKRHIDSWLNKGFPNFLKTLEQYLQLGSGLIGPSSNLRRTLFS